MVTPMELEKINSNSLLRDVVSILYDQFSIERCKVILNISSEILYYMEDVSLFEKIIMNLSRIFGIWCGSTGCFLRYKDMYYRV